MYLKRPIKRQSTTCNIDIIEKMDLHLLKIFLVLFFVNLSKEKNQTEQRNGKLFREYFFLAKTDENYTQCYIFFLYAIEFF